MKRDLAYYSGMFVLGMESYKETHCTNRACRCSPGPVGVKGHSNRVQQFARLWSHFVPLGPWY